MRPEEVRRALAAGDTYLAAFQYKAAAYQAENRPNWKVRPKLHYFGHQILGQIAASALNPRHVHCFSDEDMVGKIARIAKATHSSKTSLRTLQRWALLIAKRWDDIRAEAPQR